MNLVKKIVGSFQNFRKKLYSSEDTNLIAINLWDESNNQKSIIIEERDLQQNVINPLMTKIPMELINIIVMYAGKYVTLNCEIPKNMTCPCNMFNLSTHTAEVTEIKWEFLGLKGQFDLKICKNLFCETSITVKILMPNKNEFGDEVILSLYHEDVKNLLKKDLKIWSQEAETFAYANYCFLIDAKEEMHKNKLIIEKSTQSFISKYIWDSPITNTDVILIGHITYLLLNNSYNENLTLIKYSDTSLSYPGPILYQFNDQNEKEVFLYVLSILDIVCDYFKNNLSLFKK